MTSDNMNAEDNKKSIYEYIIWVLHTFFVDIRKNIVLFIMCLLFASGILVFLNSRKSDVYHASFTVTYEELVRKVYGDRLNKLNRLLRDNESKAAALLSIDESAVKTLKSIKGTNILGEDLSKDMNTDRIPFIIHIYLEDTSYIPQIQNGVVSFLENGNEFLTEKRALKIKETNEELAFIQDQLMMMDSLKKKFGTSSSSSSTKESDNSSLYQFSYELYKRKQELIKKQEMPLNIYVIDDAIVSVTSRRSYVLMLLAGMFIGAICYLGLVYFLMPALRYKES